MRGRSSILPFLQQLGLGVELVRDARDAREVAERLAAREGLDADAAHELIVQAFSEGNAASIDGSLACIEVPEGVIVALRDPSLAATLHEIRNAITAVAGWARIAKQEGGATARADQALLAIESASLVAMEAAASERAAPSKKVRALSVAPIVANAREFVEPIARERGVTIRESTPPDLKVTLARADLFSAISNLLKNAVEASRTGDEVHVQAMRNGGAIEIVVKNPSHGAGLPTVGKSTKGRGRGIGLRVVSEIARTIGGTLDFAHDSAGTMSAHLRLPETVERKAPKDPEATGTVERVLRERVRGAAIASGMRPRVRGFDAREEAPTTSTETSVLVVDDEIAIRNLVTTALRLSGIHAVGAAGPEDLASEPRHTFEIALVDLRLGDHDGLAIGRRLIEEGWARRLVIMTGAPIGAKPADVLAIVRKPFDLDELASRIAAWVAPEAGRRARTR